MGTASDGIPRISLAIQATEPRYRAFDLATNDLDPIARSIAAEVERDVPRVVITSGPGATWADAYAVLDAVLPLVEEGMLLIELR